MLSDGRLQTLWPVHCLAGTDGARILIDESLINHIVLKGLNPRFDSHSGFQDDGGARTGLEDYLNENGIETLIVYGIATDVCIKATVLDALEAGFKVVVIENLCRGVTPESSRSALEEMSERGAQIWPQLKIDRLREP
jgi:nicotinamidase/pyrazinamidase